MNPTPNTPAQNPLLSVVQDSVEKPKRKKQNRKRRASEVFQPLGHLLALLPVETEVSPPGWMINRYSLGQYDGGGRNYGLPPCLRIALVRTFDVIRLCHSRALPKWMKAIKDLDPVTDEQLRSAYLQAAYIHKLDISGLAGIIKQDEVSDEDLIQAFVDHLELNFRKSRTFVGPVHSHLIKVHHLGRRDAPKAVTEAFNAIRAAWEGHRASQIAPIPGYSNQTVEKWKECEIQEVQGGTKFNGYFSLVLAERLPGLVIENCVKGGSRA